MHRYGAMLLRMSTQDTLRGRTMIRWNEVPDYYWAALTTLASEFTMAVV